MTLVVLDYLQQNVSSPFARTKPFKDNRSTNAYLMTEGNQN